MSPADVVLLMGSVPERISDLVYGLDETRLRYRHGPAFPTLGGLIGHLLNGYDSRYVKTNMRQTSRTPKPNMAGHPTGFATPAE